MIIVSSMTATMAAMKIKMNTAVVTMTALGLVSLKLPTTSDTAVVPTETVVLSVRFLFPPIPVVGTTATAWEFYGSVLMILY